MPKFNRQNRKKIDPRYFSEELKEASEPLKEYIPSGHDIEATAYGAEALKGGATKIGQAALQQLMKWSPDAAIWLGQNVGGAGGAGAASAGGASAGAIAGAAVAGAAIGVGIGLTINYGIDWAKDAARHGRMYTADVGDLAENVRRLVKQAKTKGINPKETEELVHSWLGLAGKDKNLAKGYAKFLKFLKSGPWGKYFPAYVEIKA